MVLMIRDFLLLFGLAAMVIIVWAFAIWLIGMMYIVFKSDLEELRYKQDRNNKQ